MEINKAGAGQGMVALGLSPWVDYILPDRARSAGVGHRTKVLHRHTLAYFRSSIVGRLYNVYHLVYDTNTNTLRFFLPFIALDFRF